MSDACGANRGRGASGESSAARLSAFRRLWLAGLIGDTGDWLLLISLPLVVFAHTGSALGTSTALLLELGMAVLFAPVAGGLTDRVERRRLLVVVSLAQAVGLVPLMFSDGLPVVYTVIAVESALLTVFDPAKNAMLPGLVDDERLVSANAQVGLGQNLARLVGGPLGGALLAAGGLASVVAVDVVSYLLAAAMIAGLPAGARPARGAIEQRPAVSMRAAIRPRPVRWALLVTFVTQIAQGVFVVLFILFVARRLAGSAADTGLLRGVQAVGAIAGGVLVVALARRLSPARLTAAAAATIGVLELALWNLPGLTTWVPLYAVLFALVGLPAIALGTGLLTALQAGSEDDTRGRVFSACGLAGNVGQAVGMLAAGLLPPVLGLSTVLNAQALLFLVAAAVPGWALRPRRAAEVSRSQDRRVALT